MFWDMSRNGLQTAAYLCFLTLGSNGVDFINEDDCRRVLLCLLKSLAKVTLRLSCQLGHDLRTIDEEKESPSFIGHCPGNQSLSCAHRTHNNEHQVNTITLLPMLCFPDILRPTLPALHCPTQKLPMSPNKTLQGQLLTQTVDVGKADLAMSTNSCGWLTSLDRHHIARPDRYSVPVCQYTMLSSCGLRGILLQ